MHFGHNNFQESDTNVHVIFGFLFVFRIFIIFILSSILASTIFIKCANFNGTCQHTLEYFF